MSQEDVTRFYNDLVNDKDLQQKAAGLGQKYGDVKPDEAEIVAETVKLAQASHYSFSAEEVKEYMEIHKNRVLSDDELEAVAGGSGSANGWELCFCAVGGGGTKNSEGITCACVVAGSGKKDKNNYILLCYATGNVGNPFLSGSMIA